MFKCLEEEETICPRFNHRIADVPHVHTVCGFSAFNTQVWGLTVTTEVGGLLSSFLQAK